MKINESTLDRVIRVVLGLGIISLAFWGPKSWWGLLGLIPLATGVVGWCGVYALIGASTCPAKK
jgi:hypothetical protein